MYFQKNKFGRQENCNSFHWFTRFTRFIGSTIRKILRIREKRVSTMIRIQSSQRGLQDGWTRATFILKKNHLEKLKALAYWERKTIKEVMDEALSSYLKEKRI